MNQKIVLCMAALWLLLTCSKEENHDMEKPVIDMSGTTASPSTCDIVYKGESFIFKAVFRDNKELGNYNIEIHNNFDHHSHSTEDEHCDPDEEKTPVNPFIYNKDFQIPGGLVIYEAEQSIFVPEDADTGDYHFMVRLTDKAGWQQLKSVDIKIRERD